MRPLAGADEERVEVAAEDLLRGVAPQPLVPRLELFGCLDFRADLLLFAEPLHSMCEGCHQEAAGAARRVEQTLVFPWAEDLDDESDGAARCEVLAAVAAQVGADDLLVGGALGVDVDAGELVLRQLRDHECKGAVRKADLFVAAEDGLEFPLHFAEERLDAFPDRPAAVIRELFLRAGPEAPAVPARPLVVHLAEDEVEELPERRVLRHAFVAVNEVVAAAERRAQHLRVGPSRPRPRQHVAVIDGLVDRRPVADRFGVHLELGRLPVEKKELQAVGPQGVSAGLDLLEERLDLGDVLRGLLRSRASSRLRACSASVRAGTRRRAGRCRARAPRPRRRSRCPPAGAGPRPTRGNPPPCPLRRSRTRGTALGRSAAGPVPWASP